MVNVTRYDVLVLLGLVLLFISPILMVRYTFIEPPIPLVFHINVWPVFNPLAIPNYVTLSLSFLWTILALIQAFNITIATRGKYNLVFAWIILVISAVIQYVIITGFVVPSIQLWAYASHTIDLNIVPLVLLNSGLFFYSLACLSKL